MFLIAALPRVREAEPQSRAFPVKDWERGNPPFPTLLSVIKLRKLNNKKDDRG